MMLLKYMSAGILIKIMFYYFVITSSTDNWNKICEISDRNNNI